MEGGCVARLIAKTPCDGILPLAVGGLTLTEVLPEAITSVAPFKGQKPCVSKALGGEFPGPNRVTETPAARIVWTGQGQAMVLGPRVAPPGAAVTDQSDAWAVMALEGEGAADVLARLSPVDLRDGMFQVGHTARTLLQHMTCSLSRVGEKRFEIMVFRSMARTAAHEIETAMRTVAALG
jgi:sarcosine oxidase subunit gamma